MKAIYKNIELEPIEGIDSTHLIWHEYKGWLVAFSKGKSLISPHQYIVTKNYTIYGGFTAIKMLQNGSIKAEDYIDKSWSEEQIVKWLSEKDINWYNEKVAEIEIETINKERAKYSLT